MTNLRTDEIVFLYNLTKIGTDKNKAIYSNIYMRQIYNTNTRVTFLDYQTITFVKWT